MNDEERAASAKPDTSADSGCRAKRDFTGRRWLTVLLRGLHLAAVIALGAAAFGSPRFEQHTAGLAVLATGILLWALDIWSKPQHLKQWSGMSMFIKVALVGAMVAVPALYEPLFWIVVVWSALFSHAPASFRNTPLRLRWFP